MMRGDFESAWRISDTVLERRRRAGESCLHWPRHLQFIWDGASFDGKRVLIRCYHGLGDTIQFVRLAIALRTRAREIILWVQPSLMTLLRGVAGIDRMLALHDGAPEADYDVDIELMELPHALRLTLRGVPANVPYLRVPARAKRRPRELLHVGIAWRSGSWNPERSIPDGMIELLGVVENVRWYSLQYEARGAPLEATRLACRDLSEMAARMRTLDLIVSVDTMVAHLAGALGLPVLTLLPTECDWRWMRERIDSPWYPTMRLFRQRYSGDWSTVVEHVAHELARAASIEGVAGVNPLPARDTR
jgi:hypothetical protein